ncbi:ferrous iron transport protein B [Vagococcus sp.]|uniref:ferrous iron transport protein B n=1 Tax=Vagococcus sp. TaxID=1933889 RepID=UPI003F9DCF59
MKNERKSVALVGNPNSGKTSLFNELTGKNQSVGNWPGVTVERKTGALKGHPTIMIQDLPGIYSLSPYSPEERVARDYLLNEQPEMILNILDASNLERNLYLTTQLLELGIPVVVVLNMMDVVKKQGTTINLEKLSYKLGVPVLALSVVKNLGIEEIKHHLAEHLTKACPPVHPIYDDRLEVALYDISKILEGSVEPQEKRFFTIKYFESDELVLKKMALSETKNAEIKEISRLTEQILDDDVVSLIVNERYRWIDEVVQLSVFKSTEHRLSMSDKIDKIVTNKWLSLPIFAFVMWLVYFLAIQTIGAIGTDWVNDVLFGEIIPKIVGNGLTVWKIAPWLQSLILDGILAGVGAVLGFVPQLMVLFLCLSFLEDCGYMSRIAFVMDRLFRRFGLSGKSFIPMLVATGCGVPGIMASRTIENEKDRRMTIMTTTFMPCSAKLPIIGLVSGAFFPHSTWVAPSAYFIGIGTIVLSGILLKKTQLFSGETSPFIMELPAYHLPRLKNSVRQTLSRSASFVKKAGTIIFACSVVIWFLSSFNYRLELVTADVSILARLGQALSFIFAPLGWGDWRPTVATITGLIAKENVVGTFGILYGHLSEVSENGQEVWLQLSGSLTAVAGYSFLVFNLLCAPCFAAIGAIRREMNDWKWTTLAIGYQCLTAYVVSFIVYQLGSVLVGDHSFGVLALLAIIFIIIIGYSVTRVVKPNRKVIPISGIEVL